MKNVLIINGHQYYENVAEGKLTAIFIEAANAFFTDNGFNVKNTLTDGDYEIQEEVEKFAWADYILFQHPVYWMGVPWVTKKYIDEIFSGGFQTVTYQNDGRSSQDPSKQYGSGGLMQGKKYMLSLTYNCPASEFDNAEGFFEGLSVDQANVATHKTFQFCGVEPLETYSIHDIFKGDLDLPAEIQKFQTLLHKNFINN